MRMGGCSRQALVPPSPLSGGTDGEAVGVRLCKAERGPRPTPDFVSTPPMNRREGLERRAAPASLVLAFFALFLNLAAPPGYMVARQQGGVGVVICTGHGPMTLAGGDPSSDHKTGKTAHDSACAFAGHGLASAPPALWVLGAAPFAPAPTIGAHASDLAPGRGLAAPPPPSRAPPADLI